MVVLRTTASPALSGVFPSSAAAWVTAKFLLFSAGVTVGHGG
ncbi:hypothetical protein A2U01_0101293, partial [Trifolium medium]|nr:hypothetical protein [Trifolium medium]